MSKPWAIGKSPNVVTVGPNIKFDYQTVKDAMDAIRISPPAGIPAFDNRYEVRMAPFTDTFGQGVMIDQLPSWTTLQGDGRVASLILKTGSGDGMPAIEIGSDSHFVEGFSLRNIHVVAANASDAAVRLGPNSAGANSPYHDVEIRDCLIQGSLEAVRSQGPTTDPPGELRIFNSTLVGGRRAMNILQQQRLTVKGSYLYTDSDGNAYIDGNTANNAKGSVFLQGPTLGVLPHSDSYIDFEDCLLSQVISNNLAGGINARGWGGFLIENATESIILPTRIQGCAFWMELQDPSANTNDRNGAVMLRRSHHIPVGNLNMANCSVTMRRTDAASLNDDLLGAVYMASTHASGATIQVTGTTVRVIDEKTGAVNSIHASRIDAVNNTLEYDMIGTGRTVSGGEQVLTIDNPGGGTATKLNPVT